jgi:hypothetical protein
MGFLQRWSTHPWLTCLLPSPGREVSKAQAGARTATLALLGLLSASLYLIITLKQIRIPRDAGTYITIVSILLVLYALACTLVLAHESGFRAFSRAQARQGLGQHRPSRSRPEREPGGQVLWPELAVIIVSALAFIAVVFPDWPDLSPDAWRYIWDPQVLIHGFNPYLVAPGDPRLAFLRRANPVIYANMRFRNVPTIYPPGAQAIYLITCFILPTIYGIKGMMTLLNLTAAGLLMALLHQRGQNLRRVIIYLWNPLTVLEFALNAHLDVIAIVWILLALLVAELIPAPFSVPPAPAPYSAHSPAQSGHALARTSADRENPPPAAVPAATQVTALPKAWSRWGLRCTLIGVLLGLATLTKLWPVVLLIAFVDPHPPFRIGKPFSTQWPANRLRLLLHRDWPLYVAMAATILIGYAPFLLHGFAATGFLITYLNQNQPGAGPVVLLIRWAGSPVHLMHQKLLNNTAGHYIELAAAALAMLAALIVRWHYRTAPAAMTLALAVIWLATSPHIFAWYVTVLLPLLALYLEWPFWCSPGVLATLALWLFTGLVQISYVGYLPGQPLWVAYAEQYWLPGALLAIAALWWLHTAISLRRSAAGRQYPPIATEPTDNTGRMIVQS